MTDVSTTTICVPVCAPPEVLAPFLDSLSRLVKDGFAAQYLLTDDNQDPTSSKMLSAWASERAARVLPAPARTETYDCAAGKHPWTPSLVSRVAALKDHMIELALSEGTDAVFLVDADLVLHPLTLLALRHADEDIVAEVFWTEFEPGALELPNVWLSDAYAMVPADLVGLPPEAHNELAAQFLSRLHLPGHHPVGGLGACTFVRRRVLEAGVRFAAVPNVSWSGEDRHFCLRASVMGFSLWADTHFPPLHLYRPRDLERLARHHADQAVLTSRWDTLQRARELAVAGCIDAGDGLLGGLNAGPRASLDELVSRHQSLSFGVRANVVHPTEVGLDGAETTPVEVELSATATTGECWSTRMRVAIERTAQQDRATASVHRRPAGRITLSMVVRNEADRFLREVLEQVLPAIDDAVVIDDASDDGTADLCERLLRGVPHRILRLQHQTGHNEHELRRLQWRTTAERKPDWILNLDADELFEPDAASLLRAHADEVTESMVAFRLFDMWDRDHYRDDELWTAHLRWWPLLARFDPAIEALFPDRNLHCLRWPTAIARRPVFCSPLRVQHLGWVRPADRLEKHARYRTLDPDMHWGSARQVESILDESPNLARWAESSAASSSQQQGFG